MLAILGTDVGVDGVTLAILDGFVVAAIIRDTVLIFAKEVIVCTTLVPGGCDCPGCCTCCEGITTRLKLVAVTPDVGFGGLPIVGCIATGVVLAILLAVPTGVATVTRLVLPVVLGRVDSCCCC